MFEFLNMVILVFATVAALLFGVLSSYAVCKFCFWLMNPERKLSFTKARVNPSEAA